MTAPHSVSLEPLGYFADLPLGFYILPLPVDDFDALPPMTKQLATPLRTIREAMQAVGRGEVAIEADASLSTAGKAGRKAQLYDAASAALGKVTSVVEAAATKAATLRLDLESLALKPPADPEARDRLREIRAAFCSPSGAGRLADALAGSDTEELMAIVQAPRALALVADSERSRLVTALYETLAPGPAEDAGVFATCAQAVQAALNTSLGYVNAGLSRSQALRQAESACA